MELGAAWDRTGQDRGLPGAELGAACDGTEECLGRN